MVCSHCGREVQPTLHSASPRGYRVDYYALLTGKCELVSMKNPRNESETLVFYKLSNPRQVISCADCLARPEIQQEVEALFSAVP